LGPKAEAKLAADLFRHCRQQLADLALGAQLDFARAGWADDSPSN
jgi:hypothetical protein